MARIEITVPEQKVPVDIPDPPLDVTPRVAALEDGLARTAQVYLALAMRVEKLEKPNDPGEEEPDPGPSEPQPLTVPTWGDAPADGAEVSGTVSFIVDIFGTTKAELIANADLSKYEPKVAVGELMRLADGAAGVVGARFSFDSTRYPDGPLAVRVSAFAPPLEGQHYDQVTHSTVRTFALKNGNVAPVPELPDETGSDVEISLTATTGPENLNGAPKGWALSEILDLSKFPIGAIDFPALEGSGWEGQFSHGAEFLNGGKEQGMYVTPASRWRGVDYCPLQVVEQGGVRWLAIVPRMTPQNEYGATYGYPVETGVISSKHVQTYGYFEAEHICPTFAGAWPADWTMGPSWWPEFDIMEYVPKAHGLNKFWSAIHAQNPSNGKDTGTGYDHNSGAVMNQRFKLAGLWHPNFLAVYVNGKKVWEEPNPKPSNITKGLHEPAHRVFSMAIVGKATDAWGGATTIDPASLSPFLTANVKTYAMPVP